jgi:hypothetical protein
MGVRRPWKMRCHYDRTKVSSGDPEMVGTYTIDTARPIDAMSAHADREVAEDAAQTVSRNGGPCPSATPPPPKPKWSNARSATP